MTPDLWKGRSVLVTGHTGFKGAWLCAWLDQLGAKVSGYSLAPEGEHNLWTDLDLNDRVHSIIADINDAEALQKCLATQKPEVIFHFAAQSLVRRSYRDPVETFEANVVGVVSLLKAVAQTPSVKAVVVATSDKCYENLERDIPYAEDDRFGGRDPYSASKGCAEIAAAAMRQSFFAPYAHGGHTARIATVRAGNVIGGGDWSEDRLVPDIIRGALQGDGNVVIRSPGAIRPWQHVLEPLSGYVLLAEHLLNDEAGFDEGWNFGPGPDSEQPVIDVANGLVAALKKGRIDVQENPNALHEAKILRLDATRAQRELGWQPRLGFEDTLAFTADWYARWVNGEPASAITRSQIEAYTQSESLNV